MHRITRRVAAAGAAALLTVAGLAIAGPANASDPVTSTGTVTGATVSAGFSDTVTAPGATITLHLVLTNTSSSTQSVRYTVGGLNSVYTVSACKKASSLRCEDLASTYSVVGDRLGAGVTAVADLTLTVKSTLAPGTYPLSQQLTTTSGTTTTFSPAVSITIPAPNADLGVALAATAGPVLSSQIGYTATVTNNGPGAATASTTTVTLPSQASSVTGLPSGCTFSTTTKVVTCNTGAIANGASKTVSFTANFGLLSLGSLTATAARASSTPTDPNAANDTASKTCTVITGLIITC